MAISPLYKRVLGEQFDSLPKEIRDMHNVQSRVIGTGRCEIRQGHNPIARLIARLFGFPPEGTDVSARIEMVTLGHGEVWTRWLGECRFSSQLNKGQGKFSGLLTEKFGALLFYFSLPTNESGLRMVLHRVTCLGIPLPRLFWPIVSARENVEDGRFRFDVSVRLPVLGLLTHYSGWFEPPDLD